MTSLINRYDTEIGNKSINLQELTTELNNLTEKINEIDKEIQEQSVIFNSCEKEQEDARLLELKLKIKEIKKPRAVKIIQRWWRKIYLELKLKKLKKSKGKKSKKKRKKKK